MRQRRVEWSLGRMWARMRLPCAERLGMADELMNRWLPPSLGPPSSAAMQRMCVCLFCYCCSRGSISPLTAAAMTEAPKGLPSVRLTLERPLVLGRKAYAARQEKWDAWIFEVDKWRTEGKVFGLETCLLWCFHVMLCKCTVISLPQSCSLSYLFTPLHIPNVRGINPPDLVTYILFKGKLWVF